MVAANEVKGALEKRKRLAISSKPLILKLQAAVMLLLTEILDIKHETHRAACGVFVVWVVLLRLPYPLVFVLVLLSDCHHSFDELLSYVEPYYYYLCIRETQRV